MPLSGGTKLTLELANKLGKPVLHIYASGIEGGRRSRLDADDVGLSGKYSVGERYSTQSGTSFDMAFLTRRIGMRADPPVSDQRDQHGQNQGRAPDCLGQVRTESHQIESGRDGLEQQE
jgi:hypothetical protein